ncbi:hypothetical protein HK100_003777 [Physocladia obscura]|uniref:Uncharacterized protein n=1 Tax=Physocladia obscura TaxID=109957 RepID=A0AAD5STK3_9FUNG|nr:hypothetical protein HK100_003777 [Physocladia obscura]
MKPKNIPIILQPPTQIPVPASDAIKDFTIDYQPEKFLNATTFYLRKMGNALIEFYLEYPYFLVKTGNAALPNTAILTKLPAGYAAYDVYRPVVNEKLFMIDI